MEKERYPTMSKPSSHPWYDLFRINFRFQEISGEDPPLAQSVRVEVNMDLVKEILKHLDTYKEPFNPDLARPDCPRCGIQMVQRHNREGDRFWGCRDFPNCNGTRSIMDTVTKEEYEKAHGHSQPAPPVTEVQRRRGLAEIEKVESQLHEMRQEAGPQGTEPDEDLPF